MREGLRALVGGRWWGTWGWRMRQVGICKAGLCH